MWSRRSPPKKQEIEKYGENCDNVLDRMLKRIALFADFTPVIRAIATASHLSLFWAAAMLIDQGTSWRRATW